MKPQDILIALKLQCLCDPSQETHRWPQRRLAEQTGVSLSEVSAACRRLEAGGLLTPRREVIRSALGEFLIHGLKYVFPAIRGPAVRGMPTGYAADPLKGKFLTGPEQALPVWPDAKGTVRGIAFEPLYKSVPMAARQDPRLYEYLALVDAIRGGSARERSAAIRILSERLA